jgi:hypothetical protein
LIGESKRGRRVDVAAHQRADQGQRVGSRQRTEGELPERETSVGLLEQPAQDGRLAQIFLAHDSNHQERPRVDPSNQKGEEPKARLVGPLEVLEDEQQRPGTDELSQKVRNRFEDPDGIPAHRGATRLPELWQQHCELTLPDRIRPRREFLVVESQAGSQDIDPGRER